MTLKSLNTPGISEMGHKNMQEICAVSAGIYRFGSASNYLGRRRAFGQTNNRRDALTLNFWRCSGTSSVKFTHLTPHPGNNEHQVPPRQVVAHLHRWLANRIHKRWSWHPLWTFLLLHATGTTFDCLRWRNRSHTCWTATTTNLRELLSSVTERLQYYLRHQQKLRYQQKPETART